MKEQSTSGDLLALEHALKTKLHPIKPDQVFVGSLRTRLEDNPVYHQQRQKAYILLSVASGLLVGLIIFLIGKGFLQTVRKG
jgi:hypothetical protein